MSDPTKPINPNTATREEILALPGITSPVADRILEARPFASIDDMRRVRGIGARILKRITPFVEISDQPPVVEAEPTPVSEKPPAEAEILELDIVEEPEPSEEEISTVGEEPAETGEPVAEEPEAVAETPEAFFEEPPAVEEQPGEIAEEAEAVEEELEPLIEEPSLAEDQPLPGAPEPAVTPRQPSQVKYITRSDALWMAFGSGAISFLLAVIFTLGFLITINGGLRYARTTQLTRLGSQLDTLDTEVSSLQDDLGSLSIRLDVLDGPGGRITLLESTASQLSSDIDIFGTDLATMQSEIESMSLEVDIIGQAMADTVVKADDLSQKMDDIVLRVDAMLTRAERFQRFLDGLSDLLDSLILPEETP